MIFDKDIKVEKEDTHDKPSTQERIIVSFADGDPENPYNWRVVWAFATCRGEFSLI